MQSEFIAAINQLVAEKNLPKELVEDIVKAAIKTAYRKDYGNKDQDIEVELKGDDATVYLVKEVVKKVEFDELEINEKDAKKHDSKAKLGDMVKIEMAYEGGFGRIAAQAAKQVIIQRLQEAEREVMYEAFKDRENELINALVHRVENNQVYLDLGKITATLPMDHQIRGERYFGGQRIKIYLDKVIKTSKGPQLLISRTHSNLVNKLMELEIPEIKEGQVTIKGVSRDPGVRCKVAVSSSDEKIDPIGACVGQKGVRIQAVTNELSGERIDVIEWTDDLMDYIKRALAPAEIANIVYNKDENRAQVFVNPDQRALAIGKGGQNVRLASILTQVELDIMDVSDMPDAPEAPDKPKAKEVVAMVSDLDLSEEIVAKLTEANLEQVEQIKGLSEKDFATIEGITEKDAKQIVKVLKKVK